MDWEKWRNEVTERICDFIRLGINQHTDLDFDELITSSLEAAYAHGRLDGAQLTGEAITKALREL